MFQAEGMDGAKFPSREQREKKLPGKEAINFSVQKPLLKIYLHPKTKELIFLKNSPLNCLHFLPRDSIKHSTGPHSTQSQEGASARDLGETGSHP